MIDDADKTELLESLITAVRSISHGPTSGPLGLEMLSMAIDRSDDGLASVMSNAIDSAATTIAAAIEHGLYEIAEALREQRSDSE